MEKYSRENPCLEQALRDVPPILSSVALRVLARLGSIEARRAAGENAEAKEVEVDEMLRVLQEAEGLLAFTKSDETLEVREFDSSGARRWHVHVEKA